MDIIMQYSGLVVVGLIWGVTNPFLEQGVKKQENNQQDNSFFSWKSFIQTITNFRFLIPFSINQSGSLLFYYLLGQTPLTIGPIIANCSNTAFTIITENIIKKNNFTIQTIVGIAFIFIGMYYCLID